MIRTIGFCRLFSIQGLIEHSWRLISNCVGEAKASIGEFLYLRTPCKDCPKALHVCQVGYFFLIDPLFSFVHSQLDNRDDLLV